VKEVRSDVFTETKLKKNLAKALELDVNDPLITEVVGKKIRINKEKKIYEYSIDGIKWETLNIETT
jgi:hypothetical protein